MKTKRKAKPYAVGEAVKGVQVLKIRPRELDRPMIYTLYRVVGEKCGHEWEMDHRALTGRKYRETLAEGLCPACARLGSQKRRSEAGKTKTVTAVLGTGPTWRVQTPDWKPTSGTAEWQ